MTAGPRAATMGGTTPGSAPDTGGEDVDADRFDRMTIALSTPRRAVLRTILAGAVAALLGRGGAAEAGPTSCLAPRAACKKKTDCCSGKCTKKRGKKKGKCGPCPAETISCSERGACIPFDECCAEGDCAVGQVCQA